MPNIKYSAHVYYIILGILVFHDIISKKNNILLIISPMVIAFFYILMSSASGAYFIPRGYGFIDDYYHIIQQSDYYSLICFVIILCLIIIYEIGLYVHEKYVVHINFKNFKKDTSLFLILFLLSFSVMIGWLDIDLSLLGASDNKIVTPFQYAIFIPLLTYVIIENNSLKKNFVSLAVILILLIFSYDSKRDILMMFIGILSLNYIVNNDILFINKEINQFKVKHLLYAFPLFLIFFFIILYSSVGRGYGSYNVSSFFKIIQFSFIYITEDIFIDALMSNLEINHSYGNLVNSIDMFFNGEYKLLYGSTIFKFLFIPLPRYLVDFKPDSFVHIYTSLYDPLLRSQGSSRPVIFIGEFLWNFSYLFLPALILFSYFINRFFVKMLSYLSAGNINFAFLSILYLYITFIQYVRGGGTDLWVSYYLLSIPLLVFVNILFKTKFRFNL